MQQDWGDTFEHGSGSLQELLQQLPAAVSRNGAPVVPPMAQLVDVLHSLGADSRRYARTEQSGVVHLFNNWVAACRREPMSWS